MSNISKNLTDARKQVDTNATEKMHEAGNYRMGHIKILGFNITIENPKGSYRKGKDKDGHEWKTLMHNDYGYFVRTLGKDGDAIDVFIGPNLKSEKIYPIDQFVNGEFDETKVMLGFDSKEEAKSAYLSNYEKDWKGFKYITEVDLDTFKKWLYDGYRQRKPFAKYVALTESEHKVVKNDKGETVPKKCDKCGGEVVLQIHGEPVYVCKKCGKYFGTMPCKLEEHININKALKSLKKRRDPANIENWDTITESDIDEIWNGDGEEMNFIYPKKIPNKLYHVSPVSNRESILSNGIVPSIGDEYYDWWTYESPEGEWEDISELPELVFLSSDPEMWLKCLGNVDGYDVYEVDTNKLDKKDITLDPTKSLALRGSYCYGQIIPPSAIKIIKTYSNNMINEDFSSPLLARYAKEHGGLKVGRNGGLRDGVRAYHGGSKIDPAKVTDDMIYGEPYKYDWQNHTENEYNNSIHFADDYAVMLKPYDHKRNDNINVPTQRKKSSRYYSGVGDTGDHDKSRGGFVGQGKDAVSAPYDGFSVSNRAGEAQHYREAWNNNLYDINYYKNKIGELENKIKNAQDFQSRASLQRELQYYREEMAKVQRRVNNIKSYSKELLNKPRTINENQLRQIIRESLEEFYKGSQNEKAAYENARDCLYYGYGFKFWFERNAELLNNDAVIAKEIWKQAVEDMGNEQ